MKPDWPHECPILWEQAGGDVTLFCALAGIRYAEQGGPGREMGVLSVPAPTFLDQVRVAKRSFRHQEALYLASTGLQARDGGGGYTDAFLDHFSRHWAPLGAENDPSGMNASHSHNLRQGYHQAAAWLRQSVQQLALS